MAKDVFHYAVRKGLEKEGWLITDDPLRIQAGGADMEIDLGAEKIIAAERGEEKIAVEIKSFLSPSPINDLENAWGQSFMHARILQRKEPDRFLYLAVNLTIFETLFNEEAGEILLEEPGFRLIVFDSNKEEIVKWIP